MENSDFAFDRPSRGYHTSSLTFPRPSWLIWVADQLRRFTYKPNWQIQLDHRVFSNPQLLITMKVEDTYRPGVEVTVAATAPLALAPGVLAEDEDAFARWLAHQLQAIEVHESREWLKRDGKPFDNPHAPGAANDHGLVRMQSESARPSSAFTDAISASAFTDAIAAFSDAAP